MRVVFAGGRRYQSHRLVRRNRDVLARLEAGGRFAFFSFFFLSEDKI